MRDPKTNIHWQLANTLSELRADNSVRVIVLSGPEDADRFFTPPKEVYHSDRGKKYRNDPYRLWLTFTGILQTHQAMAESEKPIVAKVNGDAIGFGQSLAFGADLIVASEEARFIDHHMAMGEIDEVGPNYGVVPGDGGTALVPLYMPPPLAKEYLMLARPFTGRELADWGLVNYAVPAGDLDGAVDELVDRLLDRSAYALAWTKRTANRRVVDHLNQVLDAAAAYEMVNFLQLEWLDWDDPTGFDYRSEDSD